MEVFCFFVGVVRFFFVFFFVESWLAVDRETDKPSCCFFSRRHVIEIGL